MRTRAGAAVAVAAVLALGTTAVAQSTQVNEYTVQSDVAPNKPGTKAKPVPVSLKVGWTMSEASGLRPATVEQYSILVYGGTANTDLFPACTAVSINNAGSDAACPKGSKVGAGKLTALIGADNNPSDTSIRCEIPIVIYNGGKGRAAIFLKTGPPTCPTPIAQALDGRFIRAFGGKGTGLRFSVPSNLMHPIPGLSTAVTRVDTTMFRKTTRVKGKLRGYLEANQPCVKGARYLDVEFVTDDGQRTTVRDTKDC